MRLSKLVSEFRSLSEPIDRVKRLLNYSTILPRLGEATRSPENRVPGCAAQVWVEVVVDEGGRMRFGADSDSEITKGFCSCLIFLLDGAFPLDVLKVNHLLIFSLFFNFIFWFVLIFLCDFIGFMF